MLSSSQNINALLLNIVPQPPALLPPAVPTPSTTNSALSLRTLTDKPSTTPTKVSEQASEYGGLDAIYPSAASVVTPIAMSRGNATYSRPSLPSIAKIYGEQLDVLMFVYGGCFVLCAKLCIWLLEARKEKTRTKTKKKKQEEIDGEREKEEMLMAVDYEKGGSSGILEEYIRRT